MITSIVDIAHGYNMPLWFYMNWKYIIFSLLILGLKQPDNDIDIFLGPFMNNMRLIWDKGMTLFDTYLKSLFNCMPCSFRL